MSFLSFIKKPTRVIDVFTCNGAAFELFPIESASNYIPKWWSDTPANISHRTQQGLEIPMSTIRTCVGIHDLYKEGFILPLWSDVIIETDESGGWRNQFSDCFTQSSYHSKEQIGSIMNNWIHVKFMSPWMIDDKVGTKMIWQQPLWNHYPDAKFHIPPGIIDYKYLRATNVQMFFPRENNRYEFSAGMPMVHLIPCVEDVKVKIKTHLVSKEEYNKKQNNASNINWSFKNRFQKSKKILDKKESKCPFKF